MKSPRTTLMREWLIRLVLRPLTGPSDVPSRTLHALVSGGWAMTVDWELAGRPEVIPLRQGRAWVQAFKDGEKSIGGAR
jgi:hypothetical protein